MLRHIRISHIFILVSTLFLNGIFIQAVLSGSPGLYA